MNSFPTIDSTTGKPILRPSFPITYGIKIPVLVQEFDSGHSERRVKGATKHTFEFTYLVLRSTEYKTIRDFYISQGGDVNSFYWTDPTDNVTYTVRFNMGGLFSGENTGHNTKNPLYKLSIKLEETF